MAIVGIDLGTTNSLIGIIEKGRPRLFTGSDGKALVPSVVHYTEGDPVVGAEAKKKKSDIRRTIYSAKRFLGRGAGDVKNWAELLPFDLSQSSDTMVKFTVRAGNKPLTVTPIEVSATILRELKRIAEAQLGSPVKKAVVTVPAYFNDAQRNATKFAGEMAGLEVVRILNEPTAACMAYGLNKKAKGTVAVFDLGGGTFDISILRITEGVIEVLATNGDTVLGGDDFDHQIAFFLRNEIVTQNGIDAFASPETRSALVRAAEALKVQLTDNEEASLDLSFGAADFHRKVSRSEMEQWIKPVLERARQPALQCLKDAKITKDQITDVILVGGSTRSPFVQRFVAELFGRQPICSLNPDEVVAMGATVQANIMAGQTGEMLLLDVIPLSLGIETMGGVVSKLIHRNSTIPVSASETFTTYVDGQVSVDIHILQGERELVKDNRSLARFQLKGIPPLPAGFPKIEVEFIVDANGILSVRAQELRTGKHASVAVNPSYGLTDTEVENMLQSSFDNAEKDFSDRFLIEHRVEAEALIRSTRKSIERGRDLLEAVELTKIEKCLQELEQSLVSLDYKHIKAKKESLEAATNAFAERLLNRAVSEALKNKEIPS